MIIAGAFYPNYCAVKSINEKDALEEVYCYNPRNTVKVHELGSNFKLLSMLLK